MIDPFGVPPESTFKLAKRLHSLERKNISFYDNRKKGARFVFEALEKYCEKNLHSTKLHYVQGVDPGVPAPEILLTRMRETNGVILGVGDCGSCSYALIKTTLAMEKGGIPTVTVITKPFVPLVSSVLSADEASSIPLIVLETDFALGNLRQDEIERVLEPFEEEIFFSLQESTVKISSAHRS